MADIIKIGFCGTKNRESMIKAMTLMHDRGIKVTACFAPCQESIDIFTESFPKISVCGSIEDLANSGIDAVILPDCAGGTAEKAEFFIKKGIAVLAGSLPAATMAQAVSLCRTVEQSNGKYMFGTPLCFGAAVSEMEKVYSSGSLGQLIYGEGEYLSDAKDTCHNISPIFYGSRALLPILFITKETPVRLVARTSFNHKDADAAGCKAPDSIPQILVEMSSGAVVRVAASSNVYPRGIWYRLGTVNGGIETKRGSESEVNIGYTGKKPDGFEGSSQTYTPTYESSVKRKYGKIEPSLIPEILMINYFIGWLRGENGNEFDVYKAATVTSVILLGCRSGFNDGISLKVPDFRIDGIRKMYERDIQSPVPDKNGYVSLPVRALPSC